MPASLLSGTITLNFGAGSRPPVSVREGHAAISLISPKITGVVYVSGTDLINPVGLYDRCRETGERKESVCCVGS